MEKYTTQPPSFDRVVQRFDSKTGKLISQNHYTFHKVKNIGEWYERDGKKYDGTGCEMDQSPVEQAKLNPAPVQAKAKPVPAKAEPVKTEPKRVPAKPKKQKSDDLAKAAELLD